MGGSCSSAAEFCKSCQVLTLSPQMSGVEMSEGENSLFNCESSPVRLRVSSRLIYFLKHNQYGLSHYWELGDAGISKHSKAQQDVKECSSDVFGREYCFLCPMELNELVEGLGLRLSDLFNYPSPHLPCLSCP